MPEIRTGHQFLDAITNQVALWGYEVWWRGHGDQDWHLTPALYRRRHTAGYENNVALMFKRAATTRHQACPAPDDRAGWLCLMQHYRLPTRLLDWTESPLVALWFAAWSDPDKPGALWALQPFRLNQHQAGEAVVLNPLDPRAQALVAPAFDPSSPSPDRSVAIYPEQVDIRLAVQLSSFTLHGTAAPLEDLPNSRDFLLKFTIPAEAKRPLAEALDALGIRRSNLFPDLENLASELAGLEF